jgi:hypothetical protein
VGAPICIGYSGRADDNGIVHPLIGPNLDRDDDFEVRKMNAVQDP